MTTSFDLRLQVIDLRIRLERAAATAFDRACAPPTAGQQGSVAIRLLFLVALVDNPERAGAHRLAQLGRHVYRSTSNVLHGRTAGLDPTPALVAEWGTIVTDIETMLEL